MFDHFEGLALKGLILSIIVFWKEKNMSSSLYDLQRKKFLQNVGMNMTSTNT